MFGSNFKAIKFDDIQGENDVYFNQLEIKEIDEDNYSESFSKVPNIDKAYLDNKQKTMVKKQKYMLSKVKS